MYIVVYVCICTVIVLLYQGINLDKINVTLIPVPGELYVYKAYIESIDADDTSVSTATSGISSFIIRVSTKENNLTTYSVLVG